MSSAISKTSPPPLDNNDLPSLSNPAALIVIQQ
jgi:hypothetical protein